MNTLQETESKKNKKSSKESSFPEDSESLGGHLKTEKGLTLAKLEALVNSYVDKKNTESLCDSDIGNPSDIALISSSATKIKISKQGLYLYASMLTDPDNSEFIFKKDLCTCFDYYENSNVYIGQETYTGITQIYTTPFEVSECFDTGFSDLSLYFAEKKIRPGEKFSFGKNPLEAYRTVVDKKGEHFYKAKEISRTISNFPIFISKINIPLLTEEEQKKIPSGETTENLGLIENKEQPNASASSTKNTSNEAENDNQKGQNKALKLNPKKLSLMAKRKLCQNHGENYKKLMDSKEGKIRLKQMLRENSLEFNRIKKQMLLKSSKGK